VVLRHANGLETLYGHLSKINVTPMQEVAAGEVIGLGGSTGNSTGPHLHFECRFLYQTFDPEWILDFEKFGLRTRRLHLDKSYFGITKPRHGETQDYKADGSTIRESRRRPKNQQPTINPNDF
jgi:murein DD-endopeptidase MepM/ murein hydrolase activator NlpD